MQGIIWASMDLDNTLVLGELALDGTLRPLRGVKHLGLSARAYHRLIKVARTIADMADCPSIKPEHMAEALQYRILDRKRD